MPMEKQYDIDIFDYGTFKFQLESVMKEKGISKTKLCRLANMQHRQLNRYCSSDLKRIDLDILARLCIVLGCKVEELFVYIPPKGKAK